MTYFDTRILDIIEEYREDALQEGRVAHEEEDYRYASDLSPPYVPNFSSECEYEVVPK